MGVLNRGDTVTRDRCTPPSRGADYPGDTAVCEAGTAFAIPLAMNAAWSSNQSVTAVNVDTPARLHLGFLDLSGSLGRRFGSLGLSIEAFRTQLRVVRARKLGATGPGAERAMGYAERMLDALGVKDRVSIQLDTAIPDHLGLGSGTQMALAVSRAIADLFVIDRSTRELAALLQRGARSGIGIGAFDDGGFLLDGGVGKDGQVPPVIARLSFPEQWRILLIMDARGQGLHGRREIEAFRRLPPFSADLAAHLCHLTLMKILPGLQRGELQPVAEGIAELQRRVGDHFAPAQGGRFTSKAVADALSWVDSLGHCGIGQSSWGPTGFVLLPDDPSAQALLSQARRRFGELSPLRFLVTTACNEGGRVRLEHTADALKEFC